MLLSQNSRVKELAFVEFYEGRDAAWLRLAREFVGAQGRASLKRWNESWSGSGHLDVTELIPGRIAEGCHLRALISGELRIPIGDVPGESYEPV